MKRIAILTGGTSAEREIALVSAQTVERLLSGRFSLGRFVFPEERDVFLGRRGEFDVVIPVFHGAGGEDGTVQGFLETLGIPYLFSGVAAHAVAMDKDLAKRVVSSAGVRTSAWICLYAGANVTECSRGVSAPCVVKPVGGGSTQGVTIVRDLAELDRAVRDASRYSSRVIVEDFVAGDEFTVAVAEDNGEPVALPVIQIKSPSGFFDYDAKYGQRPAEKLCPAPIDPDLAKRLQGAALAAHRVIGARHLSRADFIVDIHGGIWFLEINTIPGLSVLFPRAVAASGRDFGELLAQWIEKAAG